MSVKRMTQLGMLVLVAIVAALIIGVHVKGQEDRAPARQIPFDEAKIIIELNATDEDVGIQIFLDGEGWEEVEVVGPDGQTIFEVAGQGSVGEIGVTELFFESEEPSLDDLPLEEFLALFPEGEYRFVGRTVEGDELVGTATLTHDLPAAVSLDVEGFPFIEWTPGADGPAIVGYEVVAEMEVVEASEERVFENTATLPATVESFTFSQEFADLAEQFETAGTLVEFKVEVIAIEASGNKTITEKSLLEEE